jgi:hypothetical protein
VQVAVTGPYVLDTDHGWMEIHPVWSIVVTGLALGSPSTSAPKTPGTPNGSPTAGPAAASSSGSATCEATASPSSDGYSGDYQLYVHSDQPNQKVTVSDIGDTWSGYANASGYADIRLYNTSPNEPIAVTVGAASCATRA